MKQILRFKQSIEKFLEKINIKQKLNLKKMYKTKIEISFLITLILWFYYCNLKNFKQYYDYVIKFYLISNNIICYSRFIYWKNKLLPVFEEILNLIKNENKLYNSQYFIVDSSPIPVCKVYLEKQVKTFIKYASKIYSTTGTYYGFKLHLIINNKKQIIDYQITTGKNNDLTILKTFNLEYLKNKILLADAGYISKDFKSDLKLKLNIDYITKYRKNSIEKINNLIYKNRIKIEQTFYVLKNRFCLNYNKFKSYTALKNNIICSLIVYDLFYK
jgi:hypothetical protein